MIQLFLLFHPPFTDIIQLNTPDQFVFMPVFPPVDIGPGTFMQKVDHHFGHYLHRYGRRQCLHRDFSVRGKIKYHKSSDGCHDTPTYGLGQSSPRRLLVNLVYFRNPYPVYLFKLFPFVCHKII